MDVVNYHCSNENLSLDIGPAGLHYHHDKEWENRIMTSGKVENMLYYNLRAGNLANIIHGEQK